MSERFVTTAEIAALGELYTAATGLFPTRSLFSGEVRLGGAAAHDAAVLDYFEKLDLFLGLLPSATAIYVGPASDWVDTRTFDHPEPAQ